MISKRKISMRGNKLKGTIKAMYVGQAMAEVIISVGGVDITTMISRNSARMMGLKVGDEATALINPAEVMVSTSKGPVL